MIIPVVIDSSVLLGPFQCLRMCYVSKNNYWYSMIILSMGHRDSNHLLCSFKMKMNLFMDDKKMGKSRCVFWAYTIVTSSWQWVLDGHFDGDNGSYLDHIVSDQEKSFQFIVARLSCFQYQIMSIFKFLVGFGARFLLKLYRCKFYIYSTPGYHWSVFLLISNRYIEMYTLNSVIGWECFYN